MTGVDDGDDDNAEDAGEVDAGEAGADQERDDHEEGFGEEHLQECCVGISETLKMMIMMLKLIQEMLTTPQISLNTMKYCLTKIDAKTLLTVGCKTLSDGSLGT